MGLIKKIFGAVFNLVAAILRGVFGIFGIGKKGEYFLELDESQESAPQAIQSAPEKKPEPAKVEASQSQANQSAPKAAPQPQAEPKTEAKPAAAGSAPKSSQPSLTQPSGMALAAAKADPKPAGNFATEYLVNPRITSGNRRRPGACLSPFKDMARQMQSSGG